MVGGEAAEGEAFVAELLGVGAPDAADVVDVVAFGLEAAASGGGEPVHDHDEGVGGDGFGEEFGAGPVDALLPTAPDLDEAEVVDELAADFLEQVRAGQRDPAVVRPDDAALSGIQRPSRDLRPGRLAECAPARPLATSPDTPA